MTPYKQALLALMGLGLMGCVGTTGSDLFTFDAKAGGPEDAVAGEPLTFTNGRGYHVSLTRADVRVAAVYLNRSRPISGAQETSCTLPGKYVAEVTEGLVVDTLSPDLVSFPAAGEGLEERALAAEVWLGGGDVTALADPTVVLDVAGIAEKDGESYPFEGALTISDNRAVPAADPARPGSNPICKQRIVSPIVVNLLPQAEGALALRIDPRPMFVNVDFALLDPPEDGVHSFRDETSGQPNVSLYQGLRATSDVYSLDWLMTP